MIILLEILCYIVHNFPQTENTCTYVYTYN